MKTNFIQLSAFFTLVSAIAFAQEQDSTKTKTIEEVVVSDTKFAQSKEKSGKIIEKITAKDLESKKGQSLANVLSQVAGVEVNGNQSGTGKNIEYYIRGGRSRQVLIMIDGVPMTDASGITLQYDLRLLPVDQIESIEILKGASSTLYGSGAATGVINITLKKSAKKDIAGQAYFHLGTQNTAEDKKGYPQEFNQGFSINGTKGNLSYLTSLNSTETKGISEAAGVDFEPDFFSRVNALQKIGIKATNRLSFDAYLNYDRLKSTFDAGAFQDESANVSLSEQVRFGFSPKFKYNKGEFNLVTGFNNLERKYSTFSSWSGVVNKSYYKSRNVSIDAFNKYRFSNQIFVVVGTQFQFLDMLEDTAFESIANTAAKFNSIDPYATIVYNSGFGLNVNAGTRLNMHSIYGNHFTWNINPSYQFKNVPFKLISSYSTAYITPSLYQLYSPYGNLDLTPEENITLEAGFETFLFNKKLIFNAVAFYREEKNRFEYFTDMSTWESKYVNNSNVVMAKRVETTLVYQPISTVKLNANYTYTQVEEDQSRLIPKHKVNASIDLALTKRLNWNSQYQYIDARTDLFYDASFTRFDVILKSYQLLNSTVSFDVLPNKMTVFGSVTNLFNKNFTEVAGYSTRGRNFKLGLNFKF